MPVTLVTGAPGWLGTELIQSLIKKDSKQKIRCFVLKGSNTSMLLNISGDIEIVEGDLRNKNDVERFCNGGKGGTLFHCAGVIHPTRGVKEFYEINVDGTRNLLNSASASGIRRIVAMSSNSPIGASYETEKLFDENSPYNPYMHYGKSKMLMENLLNSYQAEGLIETVIVRGTWFYGPGQPPRQTLFFTMVKEGKAPIVGSGESKRSMSYIENLCQGLLLCASVEKAKGQTYWISDSSPYTMNEIVDTIEELLEKEFNIKVAHKRLRLPDFTSKIATCVDFLVQSIGLYHQKIHVLSEMNKTIACSIEKAKRELGYNPTINLKEGMKRSIAWCLKNNMKI